MDLQAEKAMFVVSQGEGPSFTVNIKLTSPAFDAPVSEDERRAEFVAKVGNLDIQMLFAVYY